MPRLNPIAVSVICALSLAGCAAPEKKQTEQSPDLTPVVAGNRRVTTAAMYRLGSYYEGQGRYERAISAYREALKHEPLMVEAYTGLGTALAAQGRYEEAIREFQAASVLAPNAAHVHNNLGYAYLLSGAYEQAVKELEEAGRLDPAHERSRENLRLAQAKLGTAAVQASPQRGPAAVEVVAKPAAGTRLVEVAPQVFELRRPALPRGAEKIEAVLLEPLLQDKPTIAPSRSFRLEVSNGNGITGLAKRVAGRLADASLESVRLTNQLPFQQRETEIQYREGYAAEAALLADKLQRKVQVSPSKHLAAHIDVRLVLGKDTRTENAVVAPEITRRTVAAR